MNDPRPSAIDPRAVVFAIVFALSAPIAGCGDDDDYFPDASDAALDSGPEPSKKDAGSKPGTVDAGGDDDPHGGHTKHDAGNADSGANSDGGIPFGGLVVNTTPAKQKLDLFGEPGHRFWLEVNEDVLERLNAGAGAFGGGDIYTPVVSGGYADHTVVQDAESGSVADYGKMEIKLVGESTARQWSRDSIPNIHIDTDEFQMKARIGSFEHFRLNNSLVGSIFREQIAHRIFRALGYPALRASFAFLGSNVWGNDVWVPMTLIEMYKLRFCDDNEKLLGGTCENMWEFAGDLGNGGGGFPGQFGGGFPGEFGEGFPVEFDKQGAAQAIPEEYCQVKSCDNTRLGELSDLLTATPLGRGFADALADYVDWPRFHQFQCLTWMLWIGDDPIHNSNNNLIIQRDDGKMIWAPYSVDISAGQDWYQGTPLTGSSSLARGCQSDPQCWRDTLSTCEDLIEKFDKLNPEKFVDETVKTLKGLDMLRSGDLQRAGVLRSWYEMRQTELKSELARYRFLPGPKGSCPPGQELCPSFNDPYGQGSCGTPAQCEEWRCPVRWQWCQTFERCITEDQTCPSCAEDAPLYCQTTNSCVASPEECPYDCGSGYEFCVSANDCVPLGDCPDEQSIDGGVEP